MNTIFLHLLFFGIGIFQDFFITYYYRMISEKRPWHSAIFSTIVTLINLLILYKILSGIEDQVFTIILAYAFGNGVGTFIIVRR